MKKLLLFLFAFTITTHATNVICDEEIAQLMCQEKMRGSDLNAQDTAHLISTWEEIKKYNKSPYKLYRPTLTDNDLEYEIDESLEQSLFYALKYAEETCSCKDDLGLRRICHKQLLRPLILSYIEVVLKNEKLAPKYSTSPDDQEKYIEYINYLKEQKEDILTPTILNCIDME